MSETDDPFEGSPLTRAFDTETPIVFEEPSGYLFAATYDEDRRSVRVVILDTQKHEADVFDCECGQSTAWWCNECGEVVHIIVRCPCGEELATVLRKFTGQ